MKQLANTNVKQIKQLNKNTLETFKLRRNNKSHFLTVKF